jgi:hypothetical protein
VPDTQEKTEKETADQRKEREAAEKEAEAQAEKDAADVDAFWASYRGEVLVRSQTNGAFDHNIALADHEAKKAAEKEE